MNAVSTPSHDGFPPKDVIIRMSDAKKKRGSGRSCDSVSYSLAKMSVIKLAREGEEARSCGKRPCAAIAAMMTIPEAMRLPLTFGLSGALHAAALSGFVLPPSPAGLPAQPIQVRLLEGNPRAPGPISAGMSDARTASNPGPLQGHPASTASSSPTPAATPTVELPVAAIAMPATEAAPLSPENPGQRRHSGLSDSTSLSLSGTTALSPPAPASAAQTGAAAIGSLPERSGGEPHPVPGVPAGTLASPFNAPKALHTPAPEYPEEARWEKRTGLATLGFRVEADGSVAEVRMLHSSGHADLDATAMGALRHWRFVLPPGAAPASWYRYVFRFELT